MTMILKWKVITDKKISAVSKKSALTFEKDCWINLIISEKSSDW
jgi:hypothetical protein